MYITITTTTIITTTIIIYKHLAITGNRSLTLIDITAVIIFYINLIIASVYIFKVPHGSIIYLI